MIRVHRFALTREDFATMPEQERILIVLSGHALNNIGVLMKRIRPASAADGQAATSMSR